MRAIAAGIALAALLSAGRAYAMRQPFAWVHVPAAGAAADGEDVEDARGGALSALLLPTRSELRAASRLRDRAERGRSPLLAAAAALPGGMLALAPADAPPGFPLGCASVRALADVVGQFSSRIIAPDAFFLLAADPDLADLAVRFALAAAARGPCPAIRAPAVPQLLLLPPPSSALLPVPRFAFPGALETGNAETGYKLQRATNWAVCSRHVRHAVLELWDLALWFSDRGAANEEMAVAGVASQDGCLDPVRAAAEIGERGLLRPLFPVLGTAADKRAGMWPRLASCLRRDRSAEQLRELLETPGARAVIVDPEPPLFCNFYIGQMGHDGLWSLPFPAERGSDLHPAELWSPGGYHVGTLLSPGPQAQIVWALPDPRPWTGYGGMGDPDEWADEVWWAVARLFQ